MSKFEKPKFKKRTVNLKLIFMRNSLSSCELIKVIILRANIIYGTRRYVLYSTSYESVGKTCKVKIERLLSSQSKSRHQQLTN